MASTFESTSPATGEVLGSVPEADEAAVAHAVDVAKSAYEEWRLVPAPKRGELLFRFAQVLERE
jgi:aldehyde dehydrogenase (NAD+)